MAKVSLRNYNRELETMIDRGQLDEAIAHCQHILRTFPKHLETYRLLGKAYLEYKRYKDAVDIFSRVLASEPNDFVSNVGMSIIRDEENKLDDAIWHMERAFETQPSNPAIQGELQRLYGRRDGIQPPRIRMTRGALAHMYVQGELYPQAISEIKSVLKEDQGRSDMSVLLARAYFKSGQKNDAADAANSVLRRYPYCLDANRVLVEILSADRPESAQTYRQRVFELDPYATQVSGSVFQSNEVGDNAVMIERLDWNGQPVSAPSDWGATKAIAPESGFRQTGQLTQGEPDWLKMGLADSTPASKPTPTVVPPLPTSSSPFDAPAQTVPTSNDGIPDFLRAAGWGQSTGEFDESKSSFADEPASSSASAAPIEQGDLPDWVKAMMPASATAQQPPEPAQPAQPAQEEELPDWIKSIGTGALAASAMPSSDEQPDWMKTPEEPAPSTPVPGSGGQPDWMQGSGQSEPAQSFASDDSTDWLKNLDQAETSQPAASESQPDWMQSVQQTEASQLPASDDSMDWLKGLDQPETLQPAASDQQPDWMQSAQRTEASQLPASDDSMDWLTQFGSQPEEPATASTPAGNEFDFLNELSQPAAQPFDQAQGKPPAANDFDFLNELTPSAPEPAQPSAASAQDLGKSQQEIDDSLAWLENLAAKQGATEGLLVRPEDRMDKEPDWVTQAKSTPQEPVVQQPPAPPAASSVEDLGKSQQEIDDSLAWLENLAAKQGATEGLLVKPEDRMDKEPDWVTQAKSTPQEPIQPPPAPPTSKVEDLGKSQQEIDDSLAWLENLAAKQGATEGLLVKPEDRMDKEPDWVTQAKSTPQEPIQTPAPPAASSVEDLGKSQQEIDDSLAWLENLAAKQGATEGLLVKPEDRMDKEPDWMTQAKSTPQEPVQAPPAQPEPIQQPVSSADDTATWLRALEQEEAEPEPESSKDDTAMWLKSLGEPAPETPAPQPFDQAQGKPQAADDISAWLRGLEEEEQKPEPVSSRDETAMWLKGLEEEEKAPVVEPAIPAREAGGEFDWLNEIEEESAASPASVSQDEVPSWLKGIEDETRVPGTGSLNELPAWMRDETGEALAEPTKIEPTRAADWKPVEKQPEPPAPKPEPVIPSAPVVEEKPKPAPVKKAAPKVEEVKPATPPEPYKEPVTRARGTGMLVMPIDPILGSARNELSRGNIPAALETYAKLIKKGKFLDEVIFDLREALYRYPVEVSIWQALGDAYMRANRLQDALDAYTKAEELLR